MDVETSSSEFPCGMSQCVFCLFITFNLSYFVRLLFITCIISAQEEESFQKCASGLRRSSQSVKCHEQDEELTLHIYIYIYNVIFKYNLFVKV
jgi:hypothetical protein